MFFTTPTDGTTLAYEDYGTGEPIVFVAGIMTNTDMWEYQIPFFADRGYRCIALDRRGHGRSDRPRDGYDIATTAADLGALLEHLDLTGVTLVGHSGGAAEVAQYLATQGEERVSRVVFLSSLMPLLKQTDDNPDGIPEEVAEAAVFNAVRTDRGKWMARQSQVYFNSHLNPDVTPEMMDTVYRQCMSTSPWATLRFQQAIYAWDSREALRQITVPTLIVHGAADFSAPVEVLGRKIAAAMPKAETTYKEYPTGGHGLYTSHAAEFNADVLEFLER